MRRVLMISAVLSVVAGPAFAFDYVNDILIGNTVELTNNLNGDTARFHFKADNSVTMVRPGKPDETGTWRENGAELCSTFPSIGVETCRPKPLQATVPGEVSAKGNAPDGAPYDISVKWLTGQVGY